MPASKLIAIFDKVNPCVLCMVRVKAFRMGILGVNIEALV